MPFDDLKKYSIQTYEFDLHSWRTDEMDNDFGKGFMDMGICAGVAINWLNEKLSTTGGLAGTFQRKRFNQSIIGIRSIRNVVAMWEGAQTKRDFVNKEMAEVADDLGMKIDNQITLTIIEPSGITDYGGLAGDVPATLAQALLRLPQGSGALISLRQLKAGRKSPWGHTVSMYKGRSGRMYFFDASIGSYHVANASEFFRVWNDVYQNEKSTSQSFDTILGQGSWYRCFVRKAE
jgi:hypothetical protein